MKVVQWKSKQLSKLTHRRLLVSELWIWHKRIRIEGDDPNDNKMEARHIFWLQQNMWIETINYSREIFRWLAVPVAPKSVYVRIW